MAYNETEARIAEIKRQRAAIAQAKLDIFEGGQSVLVSGGISYTMPDLEKLDDQDAELLHELVLLMRISRNQEGFPFMHRTHPDFSSPGNEVIPNS